MKGNASPQEIAREALRCLENRLPAAKTLFADWMRLLALVPFAERAPDGPVVSLDQVTGLKEWRFVPKGWRSPIDHHHWAIVDDPALIEEWKRKLDHVAVQTWYLPGPTLVLVGGIR
jgi:hypothetical protein